ncbi:MAG: hypothetical protein HUJ89_01015 [Bacteroidales bacterium]|nr:hypothetical protein [Bacteroidales bacterium]
MGLRLSFFNTPKHRVFHYEPIYYSEEKEHRDELIEKIERRKAEAEGREYKSETYYPGRYIKGHLREQMATNRRHAGGASMSRLIAIISIAMLFVMIYLISDYFGFFASLLS